MGKQARKYVTRTDEAVKQALLKLLAKKPLSEITVSELADEELVDYDTLRLIIDAALLCRYGQAALFIGEGARR